jgi:hypothetical protein
MTQEQELPTWFMGAKQDDSASGLVRAAGGWVRAAGGWVGSDGRLGDGVAFRYVIHGLISRFSPPILAAALSAGGDSADNTD